MSALARLARRPALVETEPEHCDLCGAVIPAEHRHVLDVSTRDLRCACRACSLLFDRPAAADGRLRLVGDRRLALPGFVLDDLMWDELRLPVDVAFFFRSSAAERVMAFYPSPLGPTESLLSLEAWSALEAANPVLRTMTDDVEALLVDRARGARRQWLVPIDECYSLVGLIRLHWRGLTGGGEVWRELARFFEGLDERASTRRST